MEVKLFQRPDSNIKTANRESLTPVLSPIQLLEIGTRDASIVKLTENMTFDFARLESMITPLIKNVVNHCQSLPDSSHHYYTHPGGMFDYALKRTEIAVDLFRQYTVIENNEYSPKQLRWLYALFSAGLLQGIGKIQVDFSIALHDTKANYVKIWNPILDRLNGKGYYAFEFLHEENDDFRANINLLLARILTPEPGFAFIASDQEVLRVWLDLLHEDWPKTGSLGAILNYADYLALQAYFNQLLEELKKQNALFRKNFMDSSHDAVQRERMLGIEFLEWLKNELESGKIALNTEHVTFDKDGAFISSELFKLFLITNPHIKQWQAVQRGFITLGLARGGLDAQMLTRVWGNKEFNGLQIANIAAILPENVNVYNEDSKKVVRVNALEIIHAQNTGTKILEQQNMKLLDVNGKWITPPEGNDNIFKPGKLPGA